MQAEPITPIGWPGLLLLAVLFVLLPLGSVPRGMDPRGIPRKILYWTSILSLWILGTVTAGVAVWEGLGVEDLSLRALPVGWFLLWALVIYVAGVAVVIGSLGLQVAAGAKEPPLIAHLMPRERGERNLFLGLSFTAGVCEEWIYRGFALTALATLTGSVTAAVAIQAVAFGAAHAYQSRWGLVRAGILGAVLAAGPLAAGSIWPSALAHMLLDVTGGLVVWPLLGSRLVPETEEAEPRSSDEEEAGEEG